MRFWMRKRNRYASKLNTYASALGGASRGFTFPLPSGWWQVT
jgi:hypothetical protein